MKKFKADLHIHTVLSPCADLDMTPANIVDCAKKNNLKIIGITDHNSTKNAKLVRQLAEKEEIFVLCGAEVTTKEEVHCLAFFEDDEYLDRFQVILDENRTLIPNPGNHYGHQPVVDESDNIIEMIPHYLPAALKLGIYDIQKIVHDMNGIFIPAHIDRFINGIFGQLGFIPPNLKFDALGISERKKQKDVRKHYVEEKEISLLCNSDAHFLSQIGSEFSIFNIKETNFTEIKMALNQLDNRFVEIK